MKLYKLFALGVAALSLTACSDEDSFNTASDVTVQMQYDELSFAEDYSGTYYNIPVVVEGETNGPVKVSVQIAEFGETPAKQGQDFFVTSTVINIPAGENIGNIEFYPNGDDIENDDRQFSVSILSVEGAKVGTQTTTIVTLMDNERLLPEAYEKIQGVWTLEAADEDPIELTIVGSEEGEEGYLSTLTVSGWAGVSWTETQVGFQFDAAQMKALLVFNYGGYCAYEVNFTNLGLMDVMFAGVADGYLVSSGSTIATANEEYTEINFPADAAFVGALFYSSDGSFSGKVWFWYEAMKMKR